MSEITIVSGVNHHMEAFSAVSNGMTVKFVHDEANRFSENAVWAVVDGIGVIGHITENYIPAGFKAYGEDAVRSPDILEHVIRENKEYEAIIDGKRPNGCLIIFKIKEEEVLEEMEEENMIKWETNTSEEVLTLVGCSHNNTVKNIGDKVFIGVVKYSACPNGRIKGTTTAFNENGERLGVFPQSKDKVAVLKENNCSFKTNEQFKEAYASDIAETEGYVIIDISQCGRYVKLGKTIEEPVVEEKEPEMEDLSMYEIIAIATNKMNELKTLYDVENLIEEVVEETNEPKTVKTVTAGEDRMKSRIEETKALIMQKEEELSQLKADLKMYEKELANIEHRNALISEIKDNIFGLETRDIELIHKIVMADVPSSSEPEEEPSSSILEKVHEGKWLSEEEWEEYVEDYWERNFHYLRECEAKIDIEDNKAIKRFTNKVKRFNKQLNLFKSQGYNKILTLYWIKDTTVLRTVCKQFDLTATRLTGSCILKDNDISFFLEA